MNYPNMSIEVIDAIHGFFEEDVEADIYVYLAHLNENEKEIKKLSARAMQQLEDMNRCPYCGSPLKSYQISLVHEELDGQPREIIERQYCPECGGI